MKRFWITAGIALVFAVIIFQQYLATQNTHNNTVAIVSPTPQPTIIVKDIEVTVRLAQTAEEITRGLGGTVSLPENEGMLFVFNQLDTPRVFWMKDMVMPIDIIWLADEPGQPLRVVQIDANIPPPDSPNVPDAALKLYPSNQPVDYVLEMNAGWTERNNVVVGDSIDLRDLD